ncbi:serine/threonine-protein kinase [Streptomyces sp. NPDC007369]|uniref:serine/threonine-protein kinase n=1 Tax=Streptomyces sp. NPDC007369 TaxID=3154589 RepID=UPI0033ED89B1
MAEANGALIGGRYRLLDLIGQGGMGRVWRGRDETLGREVAVKQVLLPQGIGEEQRTVLVRRVVREARAAARLNHPGIVTVHDVVEHEGAPAIVMEYVTGTSLAAAVARDGGLPARRVAEIGVLLVKALAQAHAVGTIHRDLKPDNVLLTEDRVVLTDFGIAHVSDATMTLTHTGTIIGTPAYMAPEQLEGKPPTPATDLWSLGATLYSAVEGRPPFSADTFSALCVAIVTQEPPVSERAGALAPVLAGLLTKDPDRRSTAAQALAALDAVARGEDAAGAGGTVGRTAPARPTAARPTAARPTAARPVATRLEDAPPDGGRDGSSRGKPAAAVPNAPAGTAVSVEAAGSAAPVEAAGSAVPAGAAGAVAAGPAAATAGPETGTGGGGGTGGGAGSGPHAVWSRLLRGGACFALVWAHTYLWYALLGWQARWAAGPFLVAASVLAAVNAALSPRRGPIGAWLMFAGANLAVSFVAATAIWPALYRGWAPVLLNALVVATAAWALWRWIPVRRVGRRPPESAPTRG